MWKEMKIAQLGWDIEVRFYSRKRRTLLSNCEFLGYSVLFRKLP
jgi:hypothetical protein